MTAYIESYRIRGTLWGIEDHEDGKPAKEHFFHAEFLAGRRKRFECWSGGGGFGQCDTLEEAQALLRGYLRQRTEEDRKKAIQTVSDCDDVLEALQEPLARFRTGDEPA